MNVKEKIQAVGTAIKDPNRVTVSYSEIEMNDGVLFKPRDFEAEFAELGYRYDQSKLREEVRKELGEDKPAAFGFFCAASMTAIDCYNAGKNGESLTTVVPWLLPIENAGG